MFSFIGRLLGFAETSKTIKPEEGNPPKPDVNPAPTQAPPPITLQRILAAHHAGRGTPPKSLIVRQIETKLRALLADPEKNVISIHGPSKQGKTSLINAVLKQPGRALCVEASAHSENPIAELYALFLTQAGAQVEQTNALAVHGRIAAEATVTLPGIARAGGSSELGAEFATTQVPIHGTLSNAGWVAHVLKSATTLRVLCIDSFHHFDHEVQQDLARDFTLFANEGFKIVVAGTWKQRGFIVTQNGDLRGQHGEVDVNDWPDADMKAVIAAGADFLGATLTKATQDALVKQAFGSIGALQMTCRKLHELRLTDPISQTAKLSSEVNRAAQRVTGEQSEDLARTIHKVSQFGQQDATGRHVASFIAEAMLNRSFRDFAAGLAEHDVISEANTCAENWAKNQGTEPLKIVRATFNRHHRNQWAMMQAQENTTPIFVWDKSISKFVINDSMLIFVHHTNADKLRQLFLLEVLGALH
jgi:hypothetical protein